MFMGLLLQIGAAIFLLHFSLSLSRFCFCVFFVGVFFLCLCHFSFV